MKKMTAQASDFKEHSLLFFESVKRDERASDRRGIAKEIEESSLLDLSGCLDRFDRWQQWQRLHHA